MYFDEHLADHDSPAAREKAAAHDRAKAARPVERPGGRVLPERAVDIERRTAAGPQAWGVDSAAFVSIATLHKQGASFIYCYLAPYPADAWKIRTLQQVHDYYAAGFDIVWGWESDGTPGNGHRTGIDAARTSLQLLADRAGHCDMCAKKIANAPVSFNFGDSASPDRALLKAAHEGAASTIGMSRSGGYGGIDTIAYLLDEGAIHFAMQTYAWSSGHRDSRAQLYQRKNTPSLDFDVAYAVDFGQTPAIQGDDDVPSAKEIVDELLHRDCIAVPWSEYPDKVKANPTWTVRNALGGIWRDAWIGGGDAVPVAPGSKTNPYWQVRSVLVHMKKVTDANAKQLAGLHAAVAELAKAKSVDSSVADAIVAKVEEAISGISVHLETETPSADTQQVWPAHSDDEPEPEPDPTPLYTDTQKRLQAHHKEESPMTQPADGLAEIEDALNAVIDIIVAARKVGSDGWQLHDAGVLLTDANLITAVRRAMEGSSQIPSELSHLNFSEVISLVTYLVNNLKKLG
jgi:hypothetical protein